MTAHLYNGITVSYYTANQTRNIGGTPYNFKIIVDGNNATLEQIYTKIQYLLRQATDINTSGTAGVKTGKIQSALLNFVGDTLVTSQSVYIDNIQNADSNRIEFYDDSNTKRTNPTLLQAQLVQYTIGWGWFQLPYVLHGSSRCWK